MNAKQPIPVAVIIASVVVVLALVGFFGFKTLSGPARLGPSAPEMYNTVEKMALKSGGDYTKLSAEDQKYLDNMSHGHGQKLLETQYARITTSRGK